MEGRCRTGRSPPRQLNFGQGHRDFGDPFAHWDFTSSQSCFHSSSYPLMVDLFSREASVMLVASLNPSADTTL